jgi:hypothetical protein
LNILHEILPGVQGELTVPIRDNSQRVTVNSECLVEKDLGSLLSINILGNREQVCIVTEVIKNNKNEVVFLVAR